MAINESVDRTGARNAKSRIAFGVSDSERATKIVMFAAADVTDVQEYGPEHRLISEKASLCPDLKKRLSVRDSGVPTPPPDPTHQSDPKD